MKNKINILISLITSIITCLLFIPIYSKTTYNIYYGRTNIFSLIKQNSCKLCYNYNINWILLILQFIIIYILVILILKPFNKKERKK